MMNGFYTKYETDISNAVSYISLHLVQPGREQGFMSTERSLKKGEMIILKPLGTGANRIYLLKREILLL